MPEKALIYYKLPWPPSVNSSTFNNVSGRGRGRGKTALARNFFYEVSLIVRQTKIIDEPTIMVLFLHPPTLNRRRDSSNYVKATEDALKQAGAITDDHLLFTLPFFMTKSSEPHAQVWLLPVGTFDRVQEFGRRTLHNLLMYQGE